MQKLCLVLCSIALIAIQCVVQFAPFYAWLDKLLRALHYVRLDFKLCDEEGTHVDALLLDYVFGKVEHLSGRSKR